MTPITPTDHDVAYWASIDEAPGRIVRFGGPSEGPDVIPVDALLVEAQGIVHVGYQLEAAELVYLAGGGKLWLTTWGSFPIRMLSVSAIIRS